MSESLNVLKTGRYEARVKAEMATASAEADRQREEWNLRDKAQISQREAAGLKVSEHACSVVTATLSNEVNGCAEPVVYWRRQNQISTNPARVSRHPGVTVLACGEGCSREDGRDGVAPMRSSMFMTLIKRPEVGSFHGHGSEEVRGAISGSEMLSKGTPPVRQEHSMNEISVMGTDTKVPDFCKSFANSSGQQIHPTLKWRM